MTDAFDAPTETIRGADVTVNAEENQQLNEREIREGRTRLDSVPTWLGIELTGQCNINPPCVFCAGKNRGCYSPPQDYSPFEKYGKFIARAMTVSECSFGESLTHEALVPLARRIAATGSRFTFPTNGLLLDREKADALVTCGDNLEINVSVNAATPETYTKLTGRDFHRVIENVRYYLASFRKRHGRDARGLALCMLVMKLNRAEVSAFLHLAASLGTGVVLAPLFKIDSPPRDDFGYRFVYDEEVLPYETLLEIGREARTLAAALAVPLALQWDSRTPHLLGRLALDDVDIPCLVPWRWLFVQEHSRSALACCYHTVPVADLARQSLDDTWNSERMLRMRRTLLEGRVPKFCTQHNLACPVIAEYRNNGLTHRFDTRFDIDDEELFRLDEGWFPIDDIPPYVRWTRRTADFRFDTRGGDRLSIRCLCCKPGIDSTPVTGRIEIEGKRAGVFRLEDGDWHVITCGIPRPAAKADAACRIVIDNPWRPGDFLDTTDDRTLGIAVRRIWTD